MEAADWGIGWLNAFHRHLLSDAGLEDPAAASDAVARPLAQLLQADRVLLSVTHPDDERTVAAFPQDADLTDRAALPPAKVFAIPVESAGEVMGELVVVGSRTGPSVREVEVLRLVAREVAEALEAHRAQTQLSEWRTRAEQAQQQLEAYARDVRHTFLAERERANELAGALKELEQTYLATVKGMAGAVEAKDEYTAGHLVRVTRYGLLMVEAIAGSGSLGRGFEEGFLLHDIGKLAVPDAILQKRGPLTDEEWEVMRSHAEIGYRILRNIPFLNDAREIVYAHHERWDGRGYPRQLAGEEITLGARIFPVADSFDAMTSDRPYRAALDTEVALERLREGAGSQFWDEAVGAFLSLPRRKIESIREGSDVATSLLYD